MEGWTENGLKHTTSTVINSGPSNTIQTYLVRFFKTGYDSNNFAVANNNDKITVGLIKNVVNVSDIFKL